MARGYPEDSSDPIPWRKCTREKILHYFTLTVLLCQNSNTSLRISASGLSWTSGPYELLEQHGCSPSWEQVIRRVKNINADLEILLGWMPVLRYTILFVTCGCFKTTVQSAQESTRAGIARLFPCREQSLCNLT